MQQQPQLTKDILTTKSTLRMNHLMKKANDHIDLLLIDENVGSIENLMFDGIAWYIGHLRHNCPIWLNEWNKRWAIIYVKINEDLFDSRGSEALFINVINNLIQDRVQRKFLHTSLLDIAQKICIKYQQVIIREFVFQVNNGRYPSNVYDDYIQTALIEIPDIVINTDPNILLEVFVHAFHTIIPLSYEIYDTPR